MSTPTLSLEADVACGVLQNPADWAMYEAMDGWLHCQREPDKILPAGVPRAMISESDFVMYDRDDGGGRLIPRGLEKKYDFIYVNNVSTPTLRNPSAFPWVHLHHPGSPSAPG
jgi:hypothetical protein